MAPFRWSDSEVRAALGLGLGPGPGADAGAAGAENAPSSPRPALSFARVSTDSRTARPGDLFVALVGERFDGHDFVEEAFRQGAAGAVVSRDVPGAPDRALYRVPDTLAALGALAHHRRRALAVPVVGVTGSTGKTTTKELIRAALAPRYHVHATRGTLNNLVGLPLTILAAPDETQALVLEMGTNRPGEIAALTRIAAPSVAVITSVSEAHLEGLGDLDGVMREKTALVAGLDPDGVAIVGDEPPALAARAQSLHHHVRVAGLGQTADPALRGEILGVDAEAHFRFRWRGHEIALRLPGRHNVHNALLALAVADALGVPEREAADALATVEPEGMRGELLRLGQLTLVVDCYNANPASVRAAVDLLLALPAAGRRVAVLGSMLELGQHSTELHDQVLRELARRPLDLIVATGEFAAAAERTGEGTGTHVIVERDVEQAYARLRPRLQGDEIVLLKASRAVALERLIPQFQRDFAPDRESPLGAEG